MNNSTTEYTSIVVVDKNGLQGTVASGVTLSSDLEQRLLVRFENGEQVIVPRALLKRLGDGRYLILASIEELVAMQSSLRAADASGEQTLVIPVTEEQINVQRRTLDTGGVEIRKTVHERTELVDEPLLADEVEIERVAVNRIVDEAVPIRHEGDTMIIPLLEEVLVVEKRLVLREEVHVRKLRKEVHDPQEIRLREERVEIVRKPGNGQGARQDIAHEQ